MLTVRCDNPCWIYTLGQRHEVRTLIPWNPRNPYIYLLLDAVPDRLIGLSPRVHLSLLALTRLT